jgi:hypothetical protein
MNISDSFKEPFILYNYKLAHIAEPLEGNSTSRFFDVITRIMFIILAPFAELIFGFAWLIGKALDRSGYQKKAFTALQDSPNRSTLPKSLPAVQDASSSPQLIGPSAPEPIMQASKFAQVRPLLMIKMLMPADKISSDSLGIIHSFLTTKEIVVLRGVSKPGHLGKKLEITKHFFREYSAIAFSSEKGITEGFVTRSRGGWSWASFFVNQTLKMRDKNGEIYYASGAIRADHEQLGYPLYDAKFKDFNDKHPNGEQLEKEIARDKVLHLPKEIFQKILAPMPSPQQPIQFLTLSQAKFFFSI